MGWYTRIGFLLLLAAGVFAPATAWSDPTDASRLANRNTISGGDSVRTAIDQSNSYLLDQVRPGQANNLILNLQIRLANSGFYRDKLDGIYGQATRAAVVAFHKYLGLERSDRWHPDDWWHLRNLEPVSPNPRGGVEVDLTRQLLFYHGEEGVEIIPISSGNGKTYTNKSGGKSRARTPTGSFEFNYHINGYRRSYLGVLYRPWYFYGGYAIHGSPSVPSYPASHGCIRVPNWDADWLSEKLELGTGVEIFYGDPVEPPTPPETPQRSTNSKSDRLFRVI